VCALPKSLYEQYSKLNLKLLKLFLNTSLKIPIEAILFLTFEFLFRVPVNDLSFVFGFFIKVNGINILSLLMKSLKLLDIFTCI